MNRVVKLFLVLTSLAPVLITYWFVEQTDNYCSDYSLWINLQNNYSIGLFYLIATIILITICLSILFLSKKNLETFPVIIEEIKTSDNEASTFIIAYLLPLANKLNNGFNIPVLIFISFLFFFIVKTSNSYHFNPLLNFIGYHFYEVKVEGGVTYVLLTKKSINNSKNIKSISLLTEYMILENESIL